MHKAVYEVKPGMDKSQVLDILGNPKFTKRQDGKDTWRYIYFKNNTKISKSYTFHLGHIDKIGATKVKPVLLDQAMAATDMNEYERKIKLYQQAQDEFNGQDL